MARHFGWTRTQEQPLSFILFYKDLFSQNKMRMFTLSTRTQEQPSLSSYLDSHTGIAFSFILFSELRMRQLTLSLFQLTHKSRPLFHLIWTHTQEQPSLSSYPIKRRMFITIMVMMLCVCLYYYFFPHFQVREEIMLKLQESYDCVHS